MLKKRKEQNFILKNKNQCHFDSQIQIDNVHQKLRESLKK